MKLVGIVSKLFLICIGYGAACLVGGCVLVALLAIALAPESIWPSIINGANKGSVIANLGETAAWIAAFGILPSSVAIAFFEKKTMRHWQAHALYGALLGGFASLFSLGLLAGPNNGSMLIPLIVMLASFPIAGASSGITYWLVAGRMSGKAISI